MLSKLVWITLALLVLLIMGAVAQHMRYANLRRAVVQDRQPFLYGSDALHVATLVEPRPGRDLVEDLRAVKAAIEGAGRGQVVYVGQAAVRALRSTQLPRAEWGAVVFAQFPSRSVYDGFVGSAERKEALGAFERTYSQGMDRPAALNLGLPHLAFGLYALDWVRGNTGRYPFTPRTDETDRIDRNELRSHRELGADAIVVVNFIKRGTPEQQEADSAYGRQMVSLMGELGYGPMHIGRAVPLEGAAEFDQVALVFYPGVDFAADLFGSTFFGDIVGGKQLADSEAIVTVPLLGKL